MTDIRPALGRSFNWLHETRLVPETIDPTQAFRAWLDEVNGYYADEDAPSGQGGTARRRPEALETAQRAALGDAAGQTVGRSARGPVPAQAAPLVVQATATGRGAVRSA